MVVLGVILLIQRKLGSALRRDNHLLSIPRRDLKMARDHLRPFLRHADGT